MTVSRRPRFDLALDILDEGCTHDVAHDIHHRATHVDQAIAHLYDFSPENGR
jgi:hypothetical protein